MFLKQLRNKKAFLFYPVVVAMVLMNASCNKQLDVKSTSVAGEDQQWKSYNDVRSALVGMYGLFRAALYNNEAHWLLGDLRNGDFTSTSRPDLAAVVSGNLNASYPVIQDILNWQRFYAIVNACNTFIENSPKVLNDPRYTPLNNKVDIAQARALRAFAYFYMARIWGDVPLIVNTTDGSFEQLPRTAQDKVLTFAEQELLSVVNTLPYSYGNVSDIQFPGAYYGQTSDYWVHSLITKLAGYALLAHIAAWQGHYYDVAVYTDFIMQNYSNEALTYVSTGVLTTRGDDGLFGVLKPSQLLCFPAPGQLGEASTDGHIENLTIAATPDIKVARQKPDIYISKDSISAMFPPYNGNEDRFGVDTLSGLYRTAYFENYTSEIPIFAKICVFKGGLSNAKFAQYTSTLIFSRLEELTLLRAEALAVLGQTNDAIALLNKMKSNRNASAYNSNYDLITEIFNERRRELLGEGWRWYDLVRYNKIKRSNAAFNALIDNGGIYWPIAQDVLNRNTKIIQNSYWVK